MPVAASAIYFLNLRGDVLINRLYRDDVGGNMVDAFRMHIMQTKELGVCPVRQIGGCSFLYMRISNVYIVIVVSSNANVACAFKFVVEAEEQKVKVPSSHCDSRVRTICGDVMSLFKDQAKALSPQERGFSVILSDMCPSVSGITTKDAALSCELGMRALSLAIGGSLLKSVAHTSIEAYLDSNDMDTNHDGVLRRGGNLVVKFLESEDNTEFGKLCRKHFMKVSWLRPKATRSCSREIYLICQGLHT